MDRVGRLLRRIEKRIANENFGRFILVWAARRGLRLAGDFVECGVFKGDMSWVVCSTLDFAREPRTFYLYDTFAGFPEQYASPADFPDNPGFFAFAHKTFSDPRLYPSVVERFRVFPNVRVIRGVAPESVAADGPDRIAYLHHEVLELPTGQGLVIKGDETQ